MYPSETFMYADMVRHHVKWYTSYGKGGPNAPVDFDLSNLSGFTEPPLTTDNTAQ